MSTNCCGKFLENLKEEFKRTIFWNKYRSEITKKPKTNNLDYIIDPTFRINNRFFVLLFRNSHNDVIRSYLDECYMPLIEIKEFNAVIDNKPLFDQPIRNKQEAYEKNIEMSRNYDYLARNLLDYSCHQS